MRLLLFLIVFTAPFLLKAGNSRTLTDRTKKHSVSGKLRDSHSGEALPGATIYVKERQTGTASDMYGNYSLTLEEGKYTLVYSFIGYATVERKIDLSGDVRLSLELSPAENQLDEVVVTSEKSNKNVVKAEMSTFRMDIKTIQKIPALMGEVDVIKAIQLLPGVQSVGEGSSGFSVRGGAPDQNLILLDEATVYNASHLMGFFSVFNNDAIREVKLYKGDIPSNYGGRLSSVLDVRMNEGNSKKFEVNGGIGLIASRLTVEGPVVRDRSSFILSGRRTYADVFLPLSSEKALRNNRLYFYDLNAKINYRLNDNNQLFVSGYFGRDVFKNAFAQMSWGNETATIRWNHLFSKRLFSNFSAVYSNYQYFMGTPEGNSNSFEWRSNLRDVGVKGDLSYYANPKNTLRFGATVVYHMFNPGTARGVGSETVVNEVKVPANYAFETGLYAGNEQLIGKHLTLKYGLRFALFQNTGPATLFHYDAAHQATDSTLYGKGELYKTFAGLEPRLGILYDFDSRQSVKASYARTNQYLQLAQNSTVGTPLDIWFSANPNVKPQVADQVAVGYFRNFRHNTIETSVEGYYKWMDHVIDFKDFAELLLNNKLEGELRTGRGWSYGIELLARLNEKKLNGWVSYTWSRSFRKIAEINDGRAYPAPYDKPHNIAVVVNYTISKRLSVSANWIYATGAPVTFPTGRALIGGKIIAIYSDRNQYRYPDYHRLDLSLTLYSKPKPSKKYTWDLNFSVYNVYNRHNTWTINFLQEKLTPDVTYAEKVYLFGLIPSITFNFHFNHD
ncbi:MAG TPA: TonB-dependent receptor [Bacteroidales bacterium]|nr:TonB-dependent receptor [Bacteroidales bacterium]